MSYSSRFSFFLKLKSISRHQSLALTRRVVGCLFIGAAVLILCIPTINEKFQSLESLFDEKLSVLHTKSAEINADIKEMKAGSFNFFTLPKENLELKRENERLQAIASQLVSINLENERLKQMNKFVFPETKQILSTRLIFRSDGQVGMAKILAGSADGVKDGQFVVTESGALVGKIVNVSGKAAKVLLINDPKSKISVTFPTIRNKAILSGTYGENLEITFTENQTIPANKEAVIASGDDGYLPAGLIIGTVVTLRNGERAVIPRTNPKNADLVSVLEFEARDAF